MVESVKNNVPFDKSVTLEISILFSILSALGIAAITIICCAYSRKEKISFLDQKSSQIIFVFVGLLSLLASLLFIKGQSYVNFEWTIFILTLSTGTIVWGSFCFFQQRSREDEAVPGDENSSLSIFVNILTFIIICLELLIVLGSVFDEKYLNCSLFATGCVQKGTQVFIYHYKFRHLKPRMGRLYGASWYYKLIALVNFILWNESIEVTTDEQTKYLQTIFKDGYNIFAKAYTALIIDYRLICCILFVEHAIEIDNQIKRNESDKQKEIEENISKELNNKIEHSSFEEYESFRNKIKLHSGAGKLLGFVIIFLQVINAMQYTGNKAMGPWTNIMGCVAFASFAIAGLCLLSKVKNDINEKEFDGIDYLMVIMGLLSIIFWMMKATIVTIWAIRANGVNHDIHQYLIWTGVKNLLTPVIQIFQIYVFVSVNQRQCQQEEFKKSLSTYFLVPFLACTAFAIFFNLIICEYTYYVEDFVEEADLSTVLKVLYVTGSPIGLGFSLHIFVHFFMLYNRMNFYKHSYSGIRGIDDHFVDITDD